MIDSSAQPDHKLGKRERLRDLDNVSIVYSSIEHVLHRAVNNRDVIKMSDGHRNVVIR